MEGVVTVRFDCNTDSSEKLLELDNETNSEHSNSNPETSNSAHIRQYTAAELDDIYD